MTANTQNSLNNSSGQFNSREEEIIWKLSQPPKPFWPEPEPEPEPVKKIRKPRKVKSNLNSNTRYETIKISTSESGDFEEVTITKQQKAFCEEYAKTPAGHGRGITAALAVGYTGSTRAILGANASHLLARPEIIAYIRFLQTRTIAKNNWTKEGQMRKIQKWLDMAEEDRDINAAVKLIAEENKLLGFHAPLAQQNMNIISQGSGEINISFGGEMSEHPTSDSQHPAYENEDFTEEQPNKTSDQTSEHPTSDYE